MMNFLILLESVQIILLFCALFTLFNGVWRQRAFGKIKPQMFVFIALFIASLKYVGAYFAYNTYGIVGQSLLFQLLSAVMFAVTILVFYYKAGTTAQIFAIALHMYILFSTLFLYYIPAAQKSFSFDKDGWLILHFVGMLIGYIALLLACFGSIVYLVQYTLLKRKTWQIRFATRFGLNKIGAIVDRCFVLGIVSTTVSVAAGWLMLGQYQMMDYTTDFKIISTLVLLSIGTCIYIVHRSMIISRHSYFYSTIMVVVFFVLNATVGNLWTDFHRFFN
ncbi:MAG: hypothetical protein ACRCWQ_03800 [Bacilli bacterium]